MSNVEQADVRLPRGFALGCCNRAAGLLRQAANEITLAIHERKHDPKTEGSEP